LEKQSHNPNPVTEKDQLRWSGKWNNQFAIAAKQLGFQCTWVGGCLCIHEDQTWIGSVFPDGTNFTMQDVIEKAKREQEKRRQNNQQPRTLVTQNKRSIHAPRKPILPLIALLTTLKTL